MKSRAWAKFQVVRRVADEDAAGFSFFGLAPSLPMLAERAYSAGILYGEFQRTNDRGAVMESLGWTAFAAGLPVGGLTDEHGLAIGLTVGSIVPIIGGDIDRTRAVERLRRAIWCYNRSVPRTGEGA